MPSSPGRVRTQGVYGVCLEKENARVAKKKRKETPPPTPDVRSDNKVEEDEEQDDKVEEAGELYLHAIFLMMPAPCRLGGPAISPTLA